MITARAGDIHIDPAKTDQTIEGFGAYGGSVRQWQQELSPALAGCLVDDLGLTISRGPLPFDFEQPDGSLNPGGDVSKWIPIWKSLKDHGVRKFIISVWSPPPWMKAPGNHGHAEAWNADGRAGGKLLPENDAQFARMCVSFLRLFKAKVGVEVFALSVQNEPAFDEPYESCVYSPAEYVALVKTVGPAIQTAGLSTKLFGPEDIGYRDRVMSYINAVMDDPDARRYIGFVAVHGYAANGITAESPDARVWQGMYDAGAAHGKPLWMTETSGLGASWNDAMGLAKALYTSLRFGHVSGWCWWQAATGDGAAPSNQTLIAGSDGQFRSAKFNVLRQFARCVRPGAVRIAADSDDGSVLPLAFRDNAARTITVILINPGDQAVSAHILLPLASSPWTAHRTSQAENFVDAAIIPAGGLISLPPQSVSTFQATLTAR